MISARVLRARLRVAAPWFAGGAALFVAGAFYSLASGIRQDDESWFLRVVDRVSSGETLYRDVFFPSTPLSVYAARAVSSVAGTQMLVVKGLAVTCFVASALLTCLAARQLGVRGRRLVLVGAISFVLMPPQPDSLYTPFASTLLLVCLTSTLAWLRRSGTAWLAVAGVAAGATFAAKQTIGLYALAALLVAIAVEPRARLARHGRAGGFALATLSFTLAALVPLAPVWLTGGGPKFLDYGFFGHGAYARLAQQPYLHQLAAGFALLDPLSLGGLRQAGYALPILLLPLVAAAALAGAFLRGSGPRLPTIVTAAAFGAAAFAGAYPRYQPGHLIYAMDALLVATIAAWAGLRPAIPRRWTGGALVLVIVWTIGSTAVVFGTRMAKIASGELVAVGLPHFSGTLADPHDPPDRAAAAALAAVPGGSVFIVSRVAGFYYLASGVRNPTPFDVAFPTAFGRDGQRDLIRALHRRAIPAVCLAPPIPGLKPALRLAALERAIKQVMVRGRDLRVCTLYHLRLRGP